MTVERTPPMTTSEPLEVLILHVFLLSVQFYFAIVPA